MIPNEILISKNLAPNQVYQTDNFHLMVFLITMGHTPLHMAKTKIDHVTMFFERTEQFNVDVLEWNSGDNLLKKFAGNIRKVKSDLQSVQ